MSQDLSGQELVQLVRRVFAPRPQERSICFLVDLPDEATPDTPPWRDRRELVARWALQLRQQPDFELEVHLVVYRNVRANNADLPNAAWVLDPERANVTIVQPAESLQNVRSVPMEDVLARHPIFIAATEFSTTAPLKLAATRCGFRAATMPGFNARMIPALRLDYDKINHRVATLKEILDHATMATCRFVVDGTDTHHLQLDLRYRLAHASGGVFLEPGQAGNVPSGESYIVPYEGERFGDPSRTQGYLPVQLGEDVVVYRVEGNRAVEVLSPEASAVAQQQADLIAKEPAYANLAELGLGVLGDFGLEPIGQVLLDEKLGLHIAFGRSDHFGGTVGPNEFSSPSAVVHIDRVYVEKLQPRIAVAAVDLQMDDDNEMALMRDGKYVVDFEA